MDIVQLIRTSYVRLCYVFLDNNVQVTSHISVQYKMHCCSFHIFIRKLFVYSVLLNSANSPEIQMTVPISSVLNRLDSTWHYAIHKNFVNNITIMANNCIRSCLKMIQSTTVTFQKFKYSFIYHPTAIPSVI